jgi:hypothetical protein
MVFEVSDIIRDVRVAIDNNDTSLQMPNNLIDIDTLTLEQIIESKVADAARVVESTAPFYLLDSGKAFGDSIGWDGEAGYGSGHIHLPDDFLRLVTFQMSDWSYPVSEAITEEDEEYAMQRSRYAGIKGSPQKPVVAVVQQPIGLVLEFYSCYSGENAYIKRARYIPIPRVIDGGIDLCEKLRPAIVYYTAYMVALSIKDGDLATAMLNQSKELMQ